MAHDPAHDPAAGWKPHVAIGITGHRPDNPALSGNRDAVLRALEDALGAIDRLACEAVGEGREIRLFTLLAGGIDQSAARIALARRWSLVAPLPFGAGLNCAINAGAATRGDVAALCSGGQAADPEVEARAAAIRTLADSAHLFEIADRDEEIRAALERSLADPADGQAARRLDALCSANVELAGRVMIERIDLLVAVWDRTRTDLAGGTGHTVLAALETGTPVLVIDPARPESWTILTRPEELGHLDPGAAAGPDLVRLEAIVAGALAPMTQSVERMRREKWRPRSSFGFGIYRWIEWLFGGRTAKSGTIQTRFEAPGSIAAGSAAGLLDVARTAIGPEDRVVTRLERELLPNFAWADGVSSRLSDAYRSGMSVNFMLSALAIIIGIPYLPLGLPELKWVFALIELALLLAILAITYVGHARAWHRRWFETRRVAEYLRFAPAIAIMGVARPVARWPRGGRGEWPERFSRDALRNAGLPEARIDRAFLRRALEEIVLPHVTGQRRYHEAKAQQLARVDRRMDRAAESCFLAAVVSVSIWLAIAAAAAAGLVPAPWPDATAKLFTFLGVAFPTLGANLAGLRYFGDFERFAAISRATSGKLSSVEERAGLLLSGDEQRLTFSSASDLVRAVDEIIVGEIESWQSVYAAKHLGLPA